MAVVFIPSSISVILLFEPDFSQRYFRRQGIDEQMHILFKPGRDRKPHYPLLRLHCREGRHPFVRFQNELEIYQITAIHPEETDRRFKECLNISVWQLSPLFPATHPSQGCSREITAQTPQPLPKVL